MNDTDWATASFGYDDTIFDPFMGQQSSKSGWHQFYSMTRDLADPGSSMIIPPESSNFNQWEFMDHPETDDDEEEEEDDSMDFDLPTVNPHELELTPANMPANGHLMSSSAFPFASFPSRLPTAQYSFHCDRQPEQQFNFQHQHQHQRRFNMPQQQHQPLEFQQHHQYHHEQQLQHHHQQQQPQQQYLDSFGSPSKFDGFTFDRNDEFFTPVHSIDPASLQLRNDQASNAEEIAPHFSLPSPVMVSEEEPVSPSYGRAASNESSFDEIVERPAYRPQSVSPSESDTLAQEEDENYSEASPEDPASPFTPPRQASVATGGPKRKRVLQKTHFCELSLPSGQLCTKAFTRPYDLARHQETIHASVRKTYTCDACGENSKTFSRLDALSRHIRIKHAALSTTARPTSNE